jgi:hypothetical protein
MGNAAVKDTLSQDDYWLTFCPGRNSNGLLIASEPTHA